MKDHSVFIRELEMMFSGNSYKGTGMEPFVIEKGVLPIMISAPHAIKHYRNGGIKVADIYTGGMARYLHEMTGCHIIYSSMFTETDANYDEPEKNQYQKALKEYLNKNHINLLIDLHGADEHKDFAVEIGTVPKTVKNVWDEYSSLHGNNFVAETVKEVMERNFRRSDALQKEVWSNQIFDAGHQNTVTKFISEHTDVPSIQLEINRLYRNPYDGNCNNLLIESFIEIIDLFAAHAWVKAA